MSVGEASRTRRSWLGFVLFGLGLGAVGAIVFQIVSMVANGPYSVAVFLAGFFFLVLEIPFGMFIGLVAAMLAYGTYRMLSSNASRRLEVFSVGLCAFIVVGGLMSLIWGTVSALSWLVPVGFGFAGGLPFAAFARWYLRPLKDEK